MCILRWSVFSSWGAKFLTLGILRLCCAVQWTRDQGPVGPNFEAVPKAENDYINETWGLNKDEKKVISLSGVSFTDRWIPQHYQQCFLGYQDPRCLRMEMPMQLVPKRFLWEIYQDENWLGLIPEAPVSSALPSKFTLDNGLEPSQAQEIVPRQLLALMYPSDQLLGVWLAWSRVWCNLGFSYPM